MKLTIKDVLPLLRCPESHAELNIQENTLVTDEGIRYQIQDGIINLVKKNDQEKNRDIEEGYNRLKSCKYNLAVANPLYLAFVWGIGFVMTPLYMFKMLELPAGWILDVPCGNGFFSNPIYKTNPCAKFIAIDYSMEMLKSAKSRAEKKRIDNVVFIRADAADLPFRDKTFNGGISFAGFHAFPDPLTAGVEIGRSLQKDAPLLMTAACSGIRRLSDYMIDKYLIPNGYFSNSLTMNNYTFFLDNAGIKNLQVNMAGAIMVAKGYKKTD